MRIPTPEWQSNAPRVTPPCPAQNWWCHAKAWWRLWYLWKPTWIECSQPLLRISPMSEPSNIGKSRHISSTGNPKNCASMRSSLIQLSKMSKIPDLTRASACLFYLRWFNVAPLPVRKAWFQASKNPGNLRLTSHGIWCSPFASPQSGQIIKIPCPNGSGSKVWDMTRLNGLVSFFGFQTHACASLVIASACFSNISAP